MIDYQYISVGLGLLIGLIMALTGAGGSILAIPLLVFGLNLSLIQAAPIALLAIMSAATVGTLQGLRKGNVRYKTAVLIGAFGIAFAPIGVWLASKVPTEFLSLLLAVILIFVALRMWRKNNNVLEDFSDKPVPACVLNPATSRLFWTAICTRRLIITGVISGLLSGLLGVGGGFVIVPSLKKVSNFDMQTIIATSLAVIALVSAGSVSSYLLQGSISWRVAIPFVISTMIGMFIFRLFSHKVPVIISQRSFAALAIIAAVAITFRAIS